MVYPLSSYETAPPADSPSRVAWQRPSLQHETRNIWVKADWARQQSEKPRVGEVTHIVPGTVPGVALKAPRQGHCSAKSLILLSKYWWAGWGSNPLSVDYESTAYTS